MSRPSLRIGSAVLAVLLLTAVTVNAQQKPAPNPAFAPIEDVPGLPRVLLIGDSISIGYTLPVRELLKGKANVHRIPVNGGPTIRGVQSIDQWLGDSKWDVIHFNFGLHDLRQMDNKGDANAQDRRQVSPADYEKNLDQLVTRLKKTNAKLIWATTTPVPEGANARVPGDEVTYNAVALKVMQKHGITVNDLYEFAKPQLAQIQRPKDVHFTPEGSKVLAGQVVRTITAALPESR